MAEKRQSGTAPAPKKRRKNRRKAFRRGLVIYSVIFLLIGFGGLYVFSRYLDSFEQGNGDNAVSAWMNGKTEEDYRALMLSEPLLTLTEFEKNEDIVNAYFDASCAGKKISFQKTSGVYTDEKPVYTIKAGFADVARVTLRQGKDVGFGFHSWEVESAVPYISPYALSSVTIVLEAMPDEPMYLNGIPVSESYRTSDVVELPSLSLLESRYTDRPHLSRYQIDGLYGALTVTDSQGNEISATEEGSLPVYRPGGRGGYSFTVTIPAGSQLTVCGTPLTDAELIESSMNPLEGLDRFLGEGCSAASLTYSASGLYKEPVIELSVPSYMKLVKHVNEDGSIVYSPAADEALKEEHLELVKTFFDDNMKYAAGDRSCLTSVLEKTLYGTELYNYFSNSTAAMIWASDTKISYDYLRYENFVPWGENCFTCTVSYKANLSSTSWYTTNQSTLEDSYILAFVRHQNVWYAASMNLIDNPVSLENDGVTP